MRRLLADESVYLGRAEDEPWINAVLIRSRADGAAESIEPVIRPLPGR